MGGPTQYFNLYRFLIDFHIKSNYFYLRLNNVKCIMHYEWDTAKNQINQAKHGIPFEEMAQFDWDHAICVDIQIVDFEERELWLGPIATNIVAVVIVERSNDIVRIVSLRRSTRAEFTFWEKEIQNG